MELNKTDVADWHQTVPAEKRNQFLNDIVHAMTTVQKSNAGEQDFFVYAFQLESEIFAKAMSAEDYYNQIAQEINKFEANSHQEDELNSVPELEDLFLNINLNDVEGDDNNPELVVAACETVGNSDVMASQQEEAASGVESKLGAIGERSKAQAQAPAPSPAQQQSTTLEEKRKLLQERLQLILHAHKCRRLSAQTKGSWQCTLPHCKKMQALLNHMMMCKLGRSCTFPLCASLRILIAHWKNCTNAECQPCKLFRRPRRNTSTPAQLQYQGPSYNLWR